MPGTPTHLAASYVFWGRHDTAPTPLSMSLQHNFRERRRRDVDDLEGEPYSRTELPDGTIIRVETDGCGGLVEFVEGHVSDQTYAIDDVELKMDRAKIDGIERRLAEHPVTPAERHELVLDVVRNESGIKAQDIAELIQQWRSQVATSLLKLKELGLVRYTGRKEGCLWYAVMS